MTASATDLRNIACEARGPIEDQMDAADILAALGKTCRDKGIDWSQLKALVKAQIRDECDETGEGRYVESILAKADNAAAYADLLAKMNKKNFSDDAPDAEIVKTCAEATAKPVQQFSSLPTDDLGIPDFLDRTDSGATA